MIRIEHLTYTYPDAVQPALRDVSLEIETGAFALVVGPSGSGKSTLLRCLNGLVPHFSGGTIEGRVRIDDLDPIAAGPAALSALVGFVFQDPEAQFVVDRVEDEIAYALENRAISREEMRVRVGEVLAMLGLTHLRNRQVDELSGGEKQRVAIAAALALRPRVLVLDEPTSQLDPIAAEEVLGALGRLNREWGLTIVLAEHRLERLIDRCDRIVYVPGGDEPIRSGPPRSMLGHMALAPAVVQLATRLGWEPLPLSVAEAVDVARDALRSVAGIDQSDREGHTLMDHVIVKSDHEAGGLGAISGSSTASSAYTHAGRTPPPLLSVRGVHASYGSVPILRDVHLSVRDGEILGLMGHNGSGKTTLLKTIVGLVNTHAGEIELNGRSIVGRSTADICQNVAYLPQLSDDLLFAETVADELRVTLRNHNMLDRPPIRPIDLLRRLGLDSVIHAYPRDLSVGQRQRVALAAVTISRPRLLLLDEPTRGVDYRLKAELIVLLRDWAARGTGIVIVTHDVELIAQIGQRIVVLDHGRVVADGPPAKVMHQHAFLSTQIGQLFPGRGWLTVDDAVTGLRREFG